MLNNIIHRFVSLFKRETQSQYSWEYIEIKVLNADLDDCLQRAEKAEAESAHKDTLLVRRLMRVAHLEAIVRRYELQIHEETLLMKSASLPTPCGYCGDSTDASDICEDCFPFPSN